MNPVLLQKQLRDNSADLNDFYKELKTWGEEMKRKEENVSNKPSNPCKKKNIAKQPKEAAKTAKTKLGYTDYSAWDKFDVDAECEKIDYKENEESELSDECDETRRDEAYVEKDKGNVFVKKQKWDEAIACYNKAIDLYGYEPIFYANRALCFLKKHDYAKCETDCCLSLKLDPIYVKALQRRAAARQALGNLSEAESDLLKVLELEPENKESKNMLIGLQKNLQELKSAQRPVSKFTASRNNQNRKVLKNVNSFSNAPIASSEDKSTIIEVKPINKPKHLQSNKPLKRIEIQDVILTEPMKSSEQQAATPNLKSLNTEDLKIIEKYPPVGTKEQNRSEAISDLRSNLYAPRNSAQFYSQWRHLNSLEEKYAFLKLIKPQQIHLIFKESLESKVFSEIIEVLVKFFLANNEDVYSYLKYFSQIPRFTTIIMFLTETEKNYLRTLFEKVGKQVDPLELNSLFRLYEL